MAPTRDTTPQSVLERGVEGVLKTFRPDPISPHDEPIQKAVFLARLLQEEASKLQTPQERRQQAEFDRMIQNPGDKATLTQLTDQAFRSGNAHRAVDQLTHILDVQGIPRFFTPIERTLLKGFQSFGSYLPGVAVPLVKDKMREETANVILPAEPDLLMGHLEARRREGVRMNVNYLGEALLGEEEAQTRLERYLEALQDPHIEVISVKISTIYSQISSLAREHTIHVLCDRLELLYRAAAKMRFERADGTEVPKFVYLDMEEYRDMEITAEAFRRALDRRGLEKVAAGIALQAYVPDAYRVHLELNEWARRRVASGGSPITIRIVKGANMESERVEASIRGWPQAPYRTKLETDANYKKMLHEGMKPENLAAVRLGIASHNVFELAYGLVLAVGEGALDRVQFEMLEGMANHQRRALFELTRNVLLYAPACRKEDFIHAIGYLVRRLDENTGPDNFLRHAFRIRVGSPEWNRLEDAFLDSFEAAGGVSDSPRRIQNRLTGERGPAPVGSAWRGFVNEPDTDFSLSHNVDWARGILEAWRDRCAERAARIPLVVDGETIRENREERECRDPSRPGVVVGRYLHATGDDILRAVSCAQADPDGWRELSVEERSATLRGVAEEVRKARGDLLGAALADGGKTLLESDPEVSEAIDFLEFYGRAAEFFHSLAGVRARGRGVVAVVPPWNFPIAIPCGGVAAALAAGNTVILKPASDTVLVAHVLCECFWRAGVSRRALQFVPCSGSSVGSKLVTHPGVDTVILTGGTDTAFRMLESKPDMDLLAETGGKNATIVTALSDRDQAIKNVIHSAFGHGGQKCSATSLLILEEEIYEDESFRKTLCDAVESLEVGPAWNLQSRMGPLIRPPEGVLETGLKELEEGESWAVMPRQLDDNPNLYSPGVKWGVTPGSFTHMTEFFGPLLGVMRARNLHQAIAMVNQTGYGLTSGLESLDDREQELWRDAVRAGNLYINRGTTGAIVLRQPFGGMGKSAFGPGIKAGGPNYVAQLMEFEATGEPEGSDRIGDPLLAALCTELVKRREGYSPRERAELDRIVAAARSYDLNMRREFGEVHDAFRLVGQDNLRRYLTLDDVRVRVDPTDSLFEIFARVCAARAAGARVTVSTGRGAMVPEIRLLEEVTEGWAAAIEFVEETDAELAEAMRQGQTERVRYAAPERVPTEVFEAVRDTGLYVARAPVHAEGRIELLWYLREQSVTVDYHRYGNLGARATEERADVR